MPETTALPPPTDFTKAEVLRLVTLLHDKKQDLTLEYAATIRHTGKTGGLLTKSMMFAYTVALNDAIKLLTKEIK